MHASEVSGSCSKVDELLEVLGEMNRVPRELEDEINEEVETAEKSESCKKEWGVNRGGHEGILGVEGDVDPKLRVYTAHGRRRRMMWTKEKERLR